MIDTIHAKWLKEMGDYLLVQFTNDIYGSVLYWIFLCFFLVFSLIRLFPMRHGGAGLNEAILVFIIFIMVVPYNFDTKSEKGAPIFYHIVNVSSEVIGRLTQKMYLKVLGKNAPNQTMPPGYVYNAIANAAAMEIKDPALKKDILIIMKSCIPSAETTSGERISAKHIFGGKSELNPTTGTERIEFAFDPQLLKNRTVLTQFGAQIDCMSLVQSARRRLRVSVKGEKISELPKEIIYLGSAKGEWKDSFHPDTTWDFRNGTTRNIELVAANLAQANAIQRLVLQEDFNIGVDSNASSYSRSHGTLNPHVEVSKNILEDGVFDPTRIVTELYTSTKAVSRSLNLDGALTAAQNLADINEKMNKLPLYTALALMLLKLLSPLISLALFARQFNIFKIYVTAFVAVSVFPSIIMINRALTNSYLIYQTKLNQIVNDSATQSWSLHLGVNFDAVAPLLDDTRMVMQTMMEAEIAIISLVSGLSLITGMIAMPAAGKMLGRVAGATSSTVGRQAIQQATSSAFKRSPISQDNKTSRPSILGTAASFAGAKAAGAYRGVSSIYKSLRNKGKS